MSDYTAQVYEAQKESGERRPNGALNLKSLKPIHHKIINLHIQGTKNCDIAHAVGKTEATISRILSDPLVVGELDKAYEVEQMRLRSLTGKAIDAVEDALDDENKGMKLRGVDRFVKLHERIGKGKKDEQTAEDIIANIMNLQLNVNINSG